MLQIKKIVIILFFAYLVLTIYGLFFNYTYVDEVKYISKGYYILSGEVSFYNTAGFLYQHTPFSNLWFGLGQIIFGPSLLIARIQSLLLGLATLYISYLLAISLKNKIAACLTLFFIIITIYLPITYSTATPISLISFLIIAYFFLLYQALQKKSSLYLICSTLVSCSIFLTRENFFPIIIIHFFFLLLNSFSLRKIFFNLFAGLIFIFLVIIPGLPGILNIFSTMPYLNYFLKPADKIVISHHWQANYFPLLFKTKAIFEFIKIYFIYFFAFIVIIIHWQKTKIFDNKNQKKIIILMAIVLFCTFGSHLLASWKYSPRSIVPYFAYIAPLASVFISFFFASIFKNKKISKIKIYFLVFFLLFLSIVIAPERKGSTALPNKISPLIKINNSASLIKKISSKNDKIFILANTQPLYLANRKTFWPLLNEYNFFKPGDNTSIVKKYAFWNEEIADNWLSQSKIIILDKNKLNQINNREELKNLKKVLNYHLNDKNFRKISNDDEEDSLLIFKRINGI